MATKSWSRVFIPRSTTDKINFITDGKDEITKSSRWERVMGGNSTVSMTGGLKPSSRTYSRSGEDLKIARILDKEGKKEFGRPREKYVKLWHSSHRIETPARESRRRDGRERSRVVEVVGIIFKKRSVSTGKSRPTLTKSSIISV